MLTELIEYLKDKKILILGFGVEGKSTYHFLREHFPQKPLAVRYHKQDFNEESKYLENDKNLSFYTGDEYLKDIEQYDLILKSPGVTFKGIDTTRFIDKVTSQLELFFEYYDCYTIGITGTKGKSTTSTLIYQMLQQQDRKTRLLGNIGIPIFDEIKDIEKDEIVVLEISSHGLEYVKKSPNIGIILNVYEEHLDHYESLEKYVEAKYNIAKYQKESDIAIFNMDNEIMKNYSYKFLEKDYGITMNKDKMAERKNVIYLRDNAIYQNEKVLYHTTDKRNLKGNYMLNNIMFVLAVSEILDLDLLKTINTINTFEPLEHRMEFVGTFDGVEYYNNSIATIPEATIDAVETLEKVNTLIVGGNDRGVNQNGLIDFLKGSNVRNIICLPKTGEFIFAKMSNNENHNLVMVKTMEEAVNYAKELTAKGSICLLSPAASSYGYFKNFQERGRIFKELVKNT